MWQSWLYNYDIWIYKTFLVKLHESTGCNANRELMADTLRLIDKRGGGDVLSEFLQVHHPDVIQNLVTAEQARDDAETINNHGVFEVYSPDIVTYPRRMIFVGAKADLIKRVQEFLADKFKHDHIIIDDRAYIEYLTVLDSSISNQIPEKNWLIAAYRKNRV